MEKDRYLNRISFCMKVHVLIILNCHRICFSYVLDLTVDHGFAFSVSTNSQVHQNRLGYRFLLREFVVNICS